MLAKKTVYGKTHGSDMELRGGYNSRSEGSSERTGDHFDFTCRGDLLFHTIFYPEDARRFEDCLEMWREVNRVETHCKAQFAFELVLPLSPDLALEHNVAMLQEFATWYRVRHGVPVQCDIHAGVRGNDANTPSGSRDNPHAHLLMPTRTLGPEGFGQKTRHLNPPFFRGLVMEEEKLRQAWADSQRSYCDRHGIALRIEPTGFVPQPRLGPPAGWKGRPSVAATLELVRQANAEAACDPSQVLAKLTENNASFTDHDLEWLLRKHLGEGADAEKKIAVARTDVLQHADLTLLYDKASGDWSGRYSTHSVREQEEQGIKNLVALADPNSEEARTLPVGEWFNVRPGSGAATGKAVHGALARHPLLANEPDQRAAFDYTVAPGLAKVIKGRAGTGKSYTLSAIRDAFEQVDAAGKPTARVIGLSHMHAVKEAMKADGFREVYTVQHMLNTLNTTNGACWRGVAMVAVDEAAMLSTGQLAGAPATDDKPQTIGLLEWARRTGTKLVLVGDDRQLPSIERGGLFTEIANRLEQLDDDQHSDQFHAREITNVRRQRDSVDQTMSEHLARYDFDEAVRILDTPRITPSGTVKPGSIDWCANADHAQDALVETWARDITSFQDGAADPVESRFVFAFTHREVDDLNQRLREIHLTARRQRNGKSITQVPLTVCYKQPAWGEQPDFHANVPFAVGDRIQFTGTKEDANIFNGNLATITAMAPITGRRGELAWSLKALVDVGGSNKEVCWRSDDFRFIRHGYAGTGWKGQGKTIDTTYQLFSPHWDAALSYMLLTRFRNNTKLFVASPDGEPDRAWLASQMNRRKVTQAAIAWDAKSLPASNAATQLTRHDEAQTPAQQLQVEAAAASSITPSPPPVSARLIVGRDRFHQRVRQYQKKRDSAPLGAPHALLRQWDAQLADCRQTMLTNVDSNDEASRQHRDQLLTTAQAIIAKLANTVKSDADATPAIDLTKRPELRLVVRRADIGKAVDEMIADLRQQQRPQTPSDCQQSLDPRDHANRRNPRGR